jgi:hypothetical protein
MSITDQLPEERKNLNFVQFSRGAMRQHRELIRKSPLAAEILDFMVESMDRSNILVCSYKVLEEITGYKRRSIAYAVKILKDDLWIQAIKIGNVTAYAVNSAAFWTTHANSKSYSIFHATVIAAASEQEQTLEQLQNVKLKRVPVWDRKNERPVLDDERLDPPDQQDLDLT